MTLPNLELPIEDQHAAEWWRDQFADLYRSTSDTAFSEARDIVAAYIDALWPGLNEL